MSGPVAYQGSCHCGAVGFVYRTALPPQQWEIRGCQCSFCRSHGARCTSDPAGSVRFLAKQPDAWIRYRFARRTADFLICRRCGIYLGAWMPADAGGFAVVNLNALSPPIDSLAAAVQVSYDGEDGPGRVARREHRWTPVSKGLEAPPAAHSRGV